MKYQKLQKKFVAFLLSRDRVVVGSYDMASDTQRVKTRENQPKGRNKEA